MKRRPTWTDFINVLWKCFWLLVLCKASCLRPTQYCGDFWLINSNTLIFEAFLRFLITQDDLKSNKGYKKISKALLISQNTVAKVVQTFKKDGTATISQRRPSRPRKLTPRQERLLMRRVEENRHANSLQLSKEVESQTGVTISRDTIQRILQRNGMHGCRPRKKPLLKPRHKKPA